MLLTISTTRRPATDLGFLLHKHPGRFHSFDLSFGVAHAFYSEASEDRCTACLLLDVDPVGIVRGKSPDQSFLLGQYVNDRAYTASSFLSVAISQVLGTALQGSCKHRPELPAEPLPLRATVEVLPVRGGERFLRSVFEPLGYQVEAIRHSLDDQFPEWGESLYFSVTLTHTITLANLLAHLYVLVPVMAGHKHYFVGEDEVEKLLDKGEGWLATHPERDEITRRYLHRRLSLVRQAMARLVQEEAPADADEEAAPAGKAEEALETSLSLNEQRLAAVTAALKACGAKRVLDLGCGEGKLIRELLREPQFVEIVGMDVSLRSMEIAERRLKLDRLPLVQVDRIKLRHGSLLYRDRRMEGFDAAAIVEVIEHLDPPRLAAFERVVFEFARPGTVVLTTPNREYNAVWETLPAGKMRHPDHRFEWTREEFHSWAKRVAGQFGYEVAFHPIGPVHESFGSPTLMAVFGRAS